MLCVAIEMKTGTFGGGGVGKGCGGAFWNHENVLYFDQSGGCKDAYTGQNSSNCTLLKYTLCKLSLKGIGKLKVH